MKISLPASMRNRYLMARIRSVFAQTRFVFDALNDPKRPKFAHWLATQTRGVFAQMRLIFGALRELKSRFS